MSFLHKDNITEKTVFTMNVPRNLLYEVDQRIEKYGSFEVFEDPTDDERINITGDAVRLWCELKRLAFQAELIPYGDDYDTRINPETAQVEFSGPAVKRFIEHNIKSGRCPFLGYWNSFERILV